MKTLISTLSGLLFIFLINTCNDSVTPPVLDEKVEAVRTEFQKLILKHGIPGGVVGIFNGDDVTIIEEGNANIETLTPISADMKFRIASNTKTFTARTILILIDEERLSLEDNLIDILPDCNIQYADIITIEQILNHTSGIANYNGQDAFGDKWFTDATYVWSKEEILNLIRGAQPDFYPGESWNYSDSNYFLLGLIIEKVTNNTAENEITTRLINALSLQSTTFPTTPDMPEGFSNGYRYIDSMFLVDATEISPTAPWTGGAIISNIYDLGKWVKAVGTGEFLSDELKTKCFDMVIFDQAHQLGYGLGVFGFGDLRGHTGMIQGYQSCMLYSPQNEVSIVVWVNRCNETQPEQPATTLCVFAFQTMYPDLF